jgi:hypothetical protein
MMQPEENQAGPSSAPPETQAGLQETIQSPEKIIEGARNEDQLDRLKPGSGENPDDSEEKE